MFRLKKEEARALLVSSLLLMVGAGLAYVFSKWEKEPEKVRLSEENRVLVEELQLQMKADSLAYVRRRERFQHKTAELFPFDPNHADSITLCRLGLTGWQVRNLLKYRSKGGRWHSPDDFSRLYGLSAQDFKRLRPYIRIREEDAKQFWTSQRNHTNEAQAHARPQFQKTEKYAEGTTLDMNLADTTALKGIPGIGSYLSSKIVRYRERLGGFIRLSQIDEIDGLPSGISRWFTIEEHPVVTRIRINHASFKSLVRHPYLSYEQTKVIVNHIRSYGPLHSWQDLSLYEEFTEEDFHRLRPYFSFE